MPPPPFASWASGFELEITWYWAKNGTKFEWRPFFFICSSPDFGRKTFFFFCSSPDFGQKMGRNLSVTISNSDLCSSKIFWSFWPPPFQNSANAIAPEIKPLNKLILGGPYGRSPRDEGVAPNYVKIFVYKISTVIKKHWLPKLSGSKNCIWGSILGVPGGWHPLIMSKYLSVMYQLISKKTGTLAWVVPKTDYWGSIWGVPERVVHPNYVKIFVSLILLISKKKNSALA